MKPTYVTTSIAYVNADPHIGFLFELLATDVIARNAKLRGEEVFFLTGTDEHGVKVAKAAEAANKEPQEFVDEISGKFEALGKQFSIEPDYFIRTSNPEHKKFVQEKWTQLAEAGVLEKKSYSGLYCSGCEAFKTANETVDGKCAIHETTLEKVEEENWFFDISKFKSQISKWIEEHVFPETRRQEVINVLESGAYDEVSISRPKTKNAWGVEVPGDADQVMYVWVDALFNYISALQINGKENLWPADVQVIGKDILKFHAIIWPALLLATGYELPKKLLVHGFINVDGKKMSKSLGNVVTPQQLLDRYGSEATRYLLLRQLNFYEDSNFVWEEFDAIYNGELANGLGNLLARFIGIVSRANYQLNAPTEKHELPVFPDFQFDLSAINELVNRADKKISDQKLWEGTGDKLSQLGEIDEILWEIAARVEPYLPKTAEAIRLQLKSRVSEPLFARLEK